MHHSESNTSTLKLCSFSISTKARHPRWLEASSSLPTQPNSSSFVLNILYPPFSHVFCIQYGYTHMHPVITLLESTGYFSSSRGVPTQSLRTPWATYLHYLKEPSPKRHPHSQCHIHTDHVHPASQQRSIQRLRLFLLFLCFILHCV